MQALRTIFNAGSLGALTGAALVVGGLVLVFDVSALFALCIGGGVMGSHYVCAATRSEAKAPHNDGPT